LREQIEAQNEQPAIGDGRERTAESAEFALLATRVLRNRRKNQQPQTEIALGAAERQGLGLPASLMELSMRARLKQA